MPVPLTRPRRRRGGAFGALAMLATSAVLLTGCVAGPVGGHQARQLGGDPPTLEELRGVRESLPETPVARAEKLVETMFGSDRRASIAATAEILRLSGLPLVDDEGHVVAASDDLVIADALVPLRYVTWITDSVTGGHYYDGGGVASLLESFGITVPGTTTSEQLQAELRNWGKATEALPQAAFAGAASRALALHRGSLPIEGAPVEVDGLQLVLFLAQLAGQAVDYGGTETELAASASPDRLTVETASYRMAADLEDDCMKQAEKLQNTVDQIVDHGKKDLAGQVFGLGNELVLTEAFEEFAASQGWRIGRIQAVAKTLPKVVAKLGMAVSAVQVAMTVLLLMDGMRLELFDDHGGVTHFRHGFGDNTDVEFVALASFQSVSDPQTRACLKLAGVDIPNDGNLAGMDDKGNPTGWKILWDIDSAIAPNHWYHSIPHGLVLRPNRQDFAWRQPLTADGTANMTTQTRVEDESKKEWEHGVEHEVTATVSAHLESGTAPKITDFLSPASLIAVLAQVLLEDLTLPTVKREVTVGYHGQDSYVAKGQGTLSVALGGIDFSVDLYSCTGVRGPWKGEGGFRADSNMLGEIVAGWMELPHEDANEFSGTADFTLGSDLSGPQVGSLGPELDVLFRFDNPPQRGEHVDGHVGEGTWTMGGEKAGVDEVALFVGLSRGLTYDIMGVPEHPMCPGEKFEEHRWPSLR